LPTATAPTARRPTLDPPAPAEARESAPASSEAVPLATPSPGPLRREAPRFVEQDLDGPEVPPPPPPLPPPVAPGAPRVATATMTGGWTGSFALTTTAAYLACGVRPRDGDGQAYYASTQLGAAGHGKEYGLRPGEMSFGLERLAVYTVVGGTGRADLDRFQYRVRAHFTTDDERAALFEVIPTEPRYRFSPDRTRVAFSFTGTAAPAADFDLHHQVSAVTVSGTMACSGPIAEAPESKSAPR